MRQDWLHMIAADTDVNANAISQIVKTFSTLAGHSEIDIQ